MPRSPLSLLPGAALSLALFAAPASHAALGDECAADADCGEGLVCEVVGGTGCACPAGGECPECTPTELKACVPGPCAEDADCGEGLVCVSYEVPCAGVATDCAPGSECPTPEPSSCTPTTESVCAPRWVLPCEQAEDCGAGFTCEAYEICECSGGGSTPPNPTDPATPPDSGSGSGSSPGVPRDADCSCTPSEDKACRPAEVACEDDAACPEGWICQRGDVAVSPCPEGQSCEPVPTEPGPGTCQPQGWDVGVSRNEDFGAPTVATPTDGEGALSPTAATGGGCGAGTVGIGALLGLGGLLGLLIRGRGRAAG